MLGLVTKELRGRGIKGVWYCPNISKWQIEKNHGKPYGREAVTRQRFKPGPSTTKHTFTRLRLSATFRRRSSLFSVSLLRPVISHAHGHPVGPEIPRYVWKPNDHYRFLNSPPIDPDPSNLNTITMHHTNEHLAVCILRLLHIRLYRNPTDTVA